MAIGAGQVGNFVSAGVGRLVWTGGVGGLSYRTYLDNPNLFVSGISDDANVSKIAGLNFIEAFSRADAHMLIGAVTEYRY